MKKDSNNKVLVVAAHPDDELLGVGGTLCKHRDAGDNISILIMANGEDSRDGTTNVGRRLKQAKKVAAQLKATLMLKDFPDNAFDSVTLLELTKTIEKEIAKVKPNILYTHHAHDLNVDHRLTCEGVLTACRPMPNSQVEAIYCFETLSSTEWQIKDFRTFTPRHYVDVSKYVEEKKNLLHVYDEEMREYPHPRSYEGVETLAKYRGIEVGMKAAEAFEVARLLG